MHIALPVIEVQQGLCEGRRAADIDFGNRDGQRA
jgi:hypothetical protein